MKKYCLTDCFKKKMSNAVEMITAIVIGILFTIIAITALTGIAYCVGYSVHWLGFALDKKTIDLGYGTIFMFIVGSALVYWIAKMLAMTTLGTTKFIKERYEGTAQCTIFEECKETE